MNSKPDSPEKPEKPDDSEYEQEFETPDPLTESSDDTPVLLDDESEDTSDDLLGLDDFPEQEDVSEEASETFPPAEPQPRRGGFFPLFLGGVVAGGVGFASAFLLLPGLSGTSEDTARALDGVAANTADLSELSEKLDSVGASIPEATDISGLESSVAALESTIGEISGDVSSLTQSVAEADATLESSLSDLTAQLATLRERIATLEVDSGNTNSAQADEAEAQLSAFQADLESLVSEAEERIVAAEEKAQAILAEAQAAAEAREADAAREAELAGQRAALAKLKSALDAGASFDDVVAALGDLPPELARHADSGIPTLVSLQQGFAPAARSALATVQTVPEDASTGERLTAFLKRQTNARSLTPKDGNDPDAVLSRAEAHLSEGRLEETLTEVSALPEEARKAMSGWLTDAEIRQSALQAADSLSAKLN